MADPKHQGLNHAQRVDRAAIRRQQAVELRAAGASYQVIADEIGISKAAAWKLVRQGLDDVAKETRAGAEKLRALELTRLDHLIVRCRRDIAAAPNLDTRVAAVLLKAVDMRCNLLGLYRKGEPVESKLEVSGSVTHDHKIDRSAVEGKSADEIAAMYAERIAAFRNNGGVNGN